MSEEMQPVKAPPSSSGPPLLQSWTNAVTKPDEQTYIDIAAQAGENPNKAYLWIFVSGLIGMLLSTIIQTLLAAIGLGAQGAGAASAMGGLLASLLCFAPFGAALSVLGFALDVALIQFAASRFFSGGSNYKTLVYPMAAILAPLGILGALLSPFSTVPILGILTGLLGVAVLLYSIFLQVTAVKGLNQFGWGQAIGSVLIPFVALVVVVACLVAGFLVLLAPVLRNIASGLS